MATSQAGIPVLGTEASLRSQLLSAAKGSVAVRILAIALSLSTSVVLARALEPTAYGTYAYVIAIVTLLALPAQLGIPTLLVRETAKAAAQKDWATLNGLWRWATQTIVGMSFGIAAVAALVIVLGTNSARELRVSLVAGLVLVPLIALGNARGAALRGLRKVVLGQLPETVLAPGIFIALIALAWGAGWHLDATHAIAWQTLAALIAFIIGAVLLRNARPSTLRAYGRDKSRVRYWWSATLPLALMGGLQTIFNLTGVLLLGWYHPEADVAIYKVATAAAGLVSFGLQTANLILGPHFARQYVLGDLSRLQRLAAVGVLASAAMTTPAILFFLLGGRWVLGAFYGVDYVTAYGPLLVLCAGQLIASLFGSVGVLLNMTGLEGQATRWLAVAAASNIGLGMLLVPIWGTYGAAIAATASTIVWSVAYWRVALIRLGVDGSICSVIKLKGDLFRNG